MRVALGPHEIRIHDCFFYVRDHPIRFGTEIEGLVTDCHIVKAGSYTPRLFRRPRLKRFAPFARRVADTRAFWGETNGGT